MLCEQCSATSVELLFFQHHFSPDMARPRRIAKNQVLGTNSALVLARKSSMPSLATAKKNGAIKKAKVAANLLDQDVAKPLRKSRKNAKSQAEEKQFCLSVVSTNSAEDGSSGNLQTVHVCSICKAAFIDREALIDHQASHKPQCNKCQKTFNRETQLTRHIIECSKNGDEDTEEEDGTRSASGQSDGESATSTRSRKYGCKTCSKVFYTPSHLKIHMRIHSGERPYTCSDCSKTFNNNGALTKHKRIHSGEKPFKCPECVDRSFALKGTLNRHMKIHSGQKPHKCSFCNKQFIQSGGLKAHLFFHTGKNGFPCDLCDKQFNRKARLEMHKKYVHEQIRPFVCSFCERGFKRKEDLNRHSLLHTGEKNHQCPHCVKNFAIKTSLRVHMLTHLKEEPSLCKACGHAYIRKDCLARHIRKMHRESAEMLLIEHGLGRDYEIVVEKEQISEDDLSNGKLAEEKLVEAVRGLLILLVEDRMLKNFGWPTASVDFMLESVIKQCGHEPVFSKDYSFSDRIRENAKLLFTVVIEDESLKQLLNNRTIDEVIVNVINSFA